MKIQKFRSISPAPANRLAKIDLTLFKNNVTKCQPFLLEKQILGKIHEVRRAPLLAPILHTLDTLNSYIDGFSNSTNSGLKESLQNQIKEENTHFVLSQDLEYIIEFLDHLIITIDDHLLKIKNNP